MENGCPCMDSHLPNYHAFIHHPGKQVCTDCVSSTANFCDHPNRSAANGFCDNAVASAPDGRMVEKVMLNLQINQYDKRLSTNAFSLRL